MKNLIFIFFCSLSIALFAGNNKPDKAKEAKAKEWLNNQPLEFIENKGQFTTTDGKAADNVLFKTSFGNCDIYITDKGLSYVFVKIEEGSPKSEDSREEREDLKLKFGEREKEENKKVSYYRLDMDLAGANIDKANIIKEAESKQGHFNYFYANCPQGIYDVKAYGKITIKNIYKGIDWVIYTNADSKEHPLKYDFVVHPDADYKDIQIKFVNAQSTTLEDEDTKLKIQTIAGNIEEGNLYSYQTNKKDEIQSKYIIDKDSIISFEIANFDSTKTLVIDPLVWATYYGTGFALSVYTDSQNNVYLTGSSYNGFPVQQLSGAFWKGYCYDGKGDLYILKFNSQGVRQWCTFYGGSNEEYGKSIHTDSQGNIFISGETYSLDFPTQQFAGAFWQANNASTGFYYKVNGFILKFNNLGVRQLATYYGGEGQESFNEIAIDSQDNLFIVGHTASSIFPTQQLAGAYWQSNINGGAGFILKFNNQGVRLWATYYGGTEYLKLTEFISVCTDSQDNIYITGYTTETNFPTQQLAGAYWQPTIIGSSSNIVILKFNNNGIRQWATFYGPGYGSSICSDSQNNIYITGSAFLGFPIQQLAGAYWQALSGGLSDAFILKFNNAGIRQWATYYGGSNNDEGHSICVDNNNNLFITGQTFSSNFPVQQLSGEYWQASNFGNDATFILKFQNQGIRLWSTYYGKSFYNIGESMTIDSQNAVYVTGYCDDSCLYTKNYGNGAYYDSLGDYNSQNIYLLKIAPCITQKPTFVQCNRNNICLNDTGSITLTSFGGMGDTLNWYTGSCGQNYIGQHSPLIIPSPTQTTTYYARWERDCGVSDCDSMVITIYSSIATTQNPIICQGESYLVGTHNYNTAGIYRDTISTISGCDSIITTNLIIKPIKQTTLNSSICQGESFIIGTHIYTTAGTYKDTLTTYLGCDSIVTTNLVVNPIKQTSINPVICQGEKYRVGIHNYTLAGTYTEILTSYLGCDSIVTCNLTVKPSLIVNLGYGGEICEGDTIELSVNSGYTTYLWQDGSTNNSFLVSQAGTYWVMVNYNDCIKSDTVRYYVCANDIKIWIPNSFTPNGDGLNDEFKIETIAEFSKFQMSIYNLWGQLIFESKDAKNGWDGKFNGELVPIGVYTHNIEYMAKENKQAKRFSGRVTVVR